MKISLISTENESEYKASNERGHDVLMSGIGKGLSPMETLLMSTAGCSSIDIELILAKMRQELTKLEVVVDGERRDEPEPKVFKKISLHYKLFGKIKEKKASEAVRLSVEKYCSVISSLDPAIEIVYTFEIIE